MTENDRIEREIAIAAPAERVWDLISRPGWFINDGAVIEHRIEDRGDLHIVHDPVHGAFPIRTESLDPPRYAAFRWLAEEGEGGGGAASTLVEFWIDDARDGGVVLRVVESGFSSLGGSEEDRRRRIEENTEGWVTELAAARSFSDPLTVERSLHIAAAPAAVWPVLTTAEHLAKWYAFDGARIDARPGGAMTLHWAEHGTFHAEVTAVDEPRRFAYRIAAAPDTEPGDTGSTLVTFTLKPSGTGTLLTVRHTGFTGLDAAFGPATEAAAAEREGWEGGLVTLAEYLAPERAR
ncbi:SRPBCC domain-containing protein [Streptomyces sp. SBT349]|uniref:SRPBCC domain-containing protein n=1 Tax=Streptomyces sp. SBT349 TaxID=1580539 RepID=UPI00066D4A50|nr:SRPBCC domain-containing protein [Streptomyces sp. SBT349]